MIDAVPNSEWLQGCVSCDDAASSRLDRICHQKIWRTQIGRYLVHHTYSKRAFPAFSP
jgi:hypothetical protein